MKTRFPLIHFQLKMSKELKVHSHFKHSETSASGLGTQAQHIGVEWMVYARMEHLQAISKFILGDALPADPASPTAVAGKLFCNI